MKTSTALPEDHSNSMNGNGHLKENDTVNKSEERSRRYNGENGFEQWGGYMAAKKAKLDAQFNNNSNKNGSALSDSEIFNGISVHINGYTDPPELQLREMFIRHGGTFNSYNSSKTTYVIATNLSAPSKNLYASKTVKPEWITESIAAGVKLDPRKYMLYNLNEENNQLTLTQLMGSKKSEVLNGNKYISTTSPLKTENKLNNTNGTNGHAKHLATNGNGSNHEEENGDSDDPSDFLNASDDEEERSRSRKGVKVGASVVKSNLEFFPREIAKSKVKMATEDGFLEEFFRNSRLHLISDQKKEMQNKIGQLRKNLSTHKFKNLDLFQTELQQTGSVSKSEELMFEESVVLMHIDMDCFFVSVGLLSRPHLRGKPTVVTHSTGKDENSKADIASASYEARKFGVRNGMWVSEARKLCSSLQVIPYDFDEYRRISELFLETIASITLDIEPCSVDEMVVNVSSVLKSVPGSNPENLAEFMRRKIFEATKCPASIGIGSNRLVAKLATKKAKPDGVYHLKDSECQDFIGKLKVGDLPGIGWSHESKLAELFSVKTCSELLKVPLKDLKLKFGDKTAEKMMQFCRGIDTSELKYGFDRPKSISVDVNYGIRFTKEEELSEFMMKLCKELASRAVRAQATSLHLTMKILSRKKGAGEPKKHGGHGIVDSLSRSTRFFQFTNDWQDIYRNTSKLLKLISIPPSDYRGIGLSLSDLQFEFDKSSTKKTAVQKTLFDLTTSRGRQMVQSARKATNNNAIKEDSSKNNDSPVNLVNGTKNGFHLETTKINKPFPVPEIRKVHQYEKTPISTSIFSISKSTVSTVSEIPHEPLRLTINTRHEDKEKVDLSVLRELPKDIAREMAQHYGINVADIDDMDWQEGEEVRRDSELPELEHNGYSASTVDTIESVIQQSVQVDPYENVEKIDPAFLSALPDSIRNEVLIQFQEAKGRKGDVVVVQNNNEPQPCSSKQALERDRAFDSVASKKPVQSTETCYKAPLRLSLTEIDQDESSFDASLLCEENMSQDDAIFGMITPPSFTRTPTSSREEDCYTPRKMSSKKRLNFDEDDEKAIKVKLPVAKREWKAFWKKPSYNAPLMKPEIATKPALNGAVEIEDVRNQIRVGLHKIDDPLPEETEGLEKYFSQLISRGWLRQTVVLLKFIKRNLKRLSRNSPWYPVLKHIIESAQQQSTKLYNHELRITDY